jgi:hypothetical protein
MAFVELTISPSPFPSLPLGNRFGKALDVWYFDYNPLYSNVKEHHLNNIKLF